MKKPLRILLILVGSPLTLMLLAVTAALLFVDANSYKPELTAAVKQATGRDLKVDGELKLSLYPRIGLTLGRTELGNAPGFGPQPFARMQTVDVQVNLIPLLYGKVEVGTVVLKGVQLNLAKNAEGVTNWADLEALAAQQQQEQQGPVVPINIEGLALEDVTLVWDDRQSGAREQLDIAHLHSGTIQYGKPFDIDLALALSSREHQADARVALKGLLMIDPLKQQFALTRFTLGVDASGKGVPMQPLKAQLQGDVVADLTAQHIGATALNLALQAVDSQGKPLSVTLAAPLAFDIAGKTLVINNLQAGFEGGISKGTPISAKLSSAVAVDLTRQSLDLKGLKLSALGVNLSGDVTGSKILETPVFRGHIASNHFNLRALLTQLGSELKTADPKAMSSVGLNTRFVVSKSALTLDGLQLTLDKSKIQGRLGINDFTQPAINFALAVDQLNADHYLPPPVPAATPAKPVDQNAPLKLPLALIRKQNIQGSLKAGDLVVSKVKLSQLDLGIRIQGGVATLRPVRTRLYGGSMNGSVQLDARGNQGRFVLQPVLTGVAINPLLKDLLNNDLIAGKADLKLDMTTAGDSVQALKSGLNGQASFRVLDGAVKGINIAQQGREGLAKLKNQPAPAAEGANQTDFAELGGSFHVVDGVVNNKDLNAKAPVLRVAGKGWADLGKSQLDYLVYGSLVNTLKGQGGKARDELRGVTVPVRIKGPFAQPKISLDIDELYKTNAKAMVDQQAAQLKEKATAELARQKALVQQQLKQKEQVLRQQAEQKAAEVKQQAEQKLDETKHQAQQKAEQLKQEAEQKTLDRFKQLFNQP